MVRIVNNLFGSYPLYIIYIVLFINAYFLGPHGPHPTSFLFIHTQLEHTGASQHSPAWDMECWAGSHVMERLCFGFLVLLFFFLCFFCFLFLLTSSRCWSPNKSYQSELISSSCSQPEPQHKSHSIREASVAMVRLQSTTNKILDDKLHGCCLFFA